jgi:peptidoglycan hydrolase CwlO-like protein
MAGVFGVFFHPVSAQDDPDAIKDDISDLEKKLKKEQKEADAIKGDLQVITGTLNTTVKVIVDTASAIKKTEETIGRKEAEIAGLEADVERNRDILAGLILEMYYRDDVVLPEVLSEEDFFRSLNDPDRFLTVGEKMNDVLARIHDVEAGIKIEKGSLETVKEEKARLLAQKEREKRGLIVEKVETEGDLEDQLATIAELQKKLKDLNNDLNELLGESYDAKDIKDAIKYAAKKTGVREGFLFGMLSVESRLGASVGGCDYKQSKMSAYRLGIFKEIASDIGKDYRKLKVSCPPASYKGTGGAMGAAQFMSDTWKGYKSTIASRTGHSNPNPWNLTDGVMAMASKLANDGATKGGSTTITSPCTGKKVSVKWETVASMKYLGWSCYALNNYSKTIQSLAGNYKDL